jgi:hypothetical protein
VPVWSRRSAPFWTSRRTFRHHRTSSRPKAGNGFAYVAWTRPVDEGGTASRYTVTSSGGQRTTISAAGFDRLGYATVTGLTNGKAYTFTVTATNASGTGSASLPSPPATPSAATVTKPGVPTKLHVTAGDGTAAVFFSPPTATGGDPLIGYRVTASTGTATTVTGRMVLLGKQSFAVFTGLHNGTAYTFTVAAVTAAGTDPPPRVRQSPRVRSDPDPDRRSDYTRSSRVSTPAGAQGLLLIEVGLPVPGISPRRRQAQRERRGLVGRQRPAHARVRASGAVSERHARPAWRG